ncbi:glycosyltransferase family 4 protein [Rothia nasimurium]|uniref:glycosyltransferase family 4 protein n=1 Tax=Rothia nasimurium TaxID=85336 RepID=UPI001F18F1AA|nr:glycosyltransferase family 4 protein [Rothia nasimurium]
MNNLIFVDHTSKLGGGELALSRYLTWEGRDRHIDLILFEEGTLAEIGRNASNVTVHMMSQKNKIARLLHLWLLISRLKGPVLANSLSAYVHLSFIPGALNRTIYYLRHEAINPDTGPLKSLYLRRYAFPQTHCFFANSEYTKLTLRKNAFIKKCKVVYTVSGIGENDIISQVHAFSQPIKLLSLSRLAPWKGVHNIIDAVNRVNEEYGCVKVHLTVAGGALFGEGQYQKYLEDMAKKSQGGITLLGNVKDIKPLLSNHDVLISASIKPEPFGQVLVQGLSAGLLTIGTAQGGATEIVTNGVTGYLLKPDDVQAVVTILKSLVENELDVHLIRELGAESSRRFTDEKMLSLLESAINEIE